MKSICFLFASFILLSFMLVSCAPQVQNALTKESQEQATDTNVNAVFLEKQESEADITVKHKILIMPFEYTSTNANYPNPLIYRTIFFSSFYNLFSVLPSIDLPDKSVLLTMNPSEETISNLADQYKCDFIVFGDYGLKGDKSKPDAVISLKIWNKFSDSISTNKIITPTDADLFDAIDSLMSKMVKTILNEEMKIAYLNFNNFDTGREPIGVFVNHRLVAEPISNDFHLNMKVISGKDYKVAIRRKFDGKLLAGSVANLKPGESMNFSATNYRVNLIKNGDFDKINKIVYLRWDWGNNDYSLYNDEHAGKWNLALSDAGKGVANIENGECHIKIINTGRHWCSVALVLAPIKIERGKNYRISFNARASEPRKIALNIAKYYIWINYLLGIHSLLPVYLTIDKKMNNYSYLFKMSNSTEEKSYFQIGFSDTVGDVWINNIWIEEID